MIPILFDKSETVFTTNGKGRLSDASSCIVTEERNGIYELEMTYPMTGAHFEDIQADDYIRCKKDASGSYQLFRIYAIKRPINGKCTILAHHVSYQMLLIPLMPFSAVGAAATFAAIPNYVVGDCPFTFYTDNTSSETYNLNYPKSLRGALQGDQWSILQQFGGDYEFDNFTVKLLTRRGSDNGVVLRYGKNIIDLKQEENIQKTYTGIVPYWYGIDGEKEVLVTLPEFALYASTAANFEYSRILPVDFTDQIEGRPTVAELRTAGNNYITRNEIGVPSVSISLNFVDLSQTEEYADRAFETIVLGDTVTVKFDDLGVSKEARVTRTKYDVLTERYTNLYIGEAYTSIASLISGQQTEQIENKAAQKSYVANALEQATSVINGDITGSSMKFITDADGNPLGWIVMDTTDESTAVNCIRCNANGMGFSSNGINGTYDTAIYYDSTLGCWVLNATDLNVINLNADNITSGTLSADRIAAGTIAVGKLDSSTQTAIDNGQSAYDRADASRGTCSTAATTAAKVVTSEGFKLSTGSAITVYFSTANTLANALTLNVNSTGAKAIYVGSSATSSSNQLLWNSGASITFVYNGTGWVVEDLPGSYAGGTCSVAAATAAKTTTTVGGIAVLMAGVTVSVPMTYANTNTSATLNVNSLGGKAIYYGTSSTAPTTSNGRGWIAGRTVTLKFTGSVWRLMETGTIIDGGHIITGTIDASVVNVINLNASYITSGTLSASYIYGGTLTLGGSSNGYGQLNILDASNNTVGTWTKDGLTATAGTIGGWTISDTTLYKSNSYGKVTMAAAASSYPQITCEGTIDQTILCGNGYTYFYTRKNATTTFVQAGNIHTSAPTSVLTNGTLVIQSQQAIKWLDGSTVRGYYQYNSNGYSTEYGASGVLKLQPATGVSIVGTLTVSSTKSRVVETDEYSNRLLYCYETASPMFGDIGEGETDEYGECYIFLDPIFAETISTSGYQVFLQKYGEGDIWVQERAAGYFLVKGTASLKFGWEIKAKQAGYEQTRLDDGGVITSVGNGNYDEYAADYIQSLTEGRIANE